MGSIDRQNISVGLPSEAQIYEREYEYWPWGKLIGFVVEWVEENASANARVLDCMCGTGFLLNELARHRPDLDCFGCDINPEYAIYAQRTYKRITVDLCDARSYESPRIPDVVICTSGIHHLPWDLQADFVRKIASQIESGKTFIVGEELIRGFNDEKTRRLAAIEMLADVLAYMIEKDAPSEMLATVADVLKADLSAQEYKFDMTTMLEMLVPEFEVEEQHCIWPDTKKVYGDYVFICRAR